MKTNGQIAYEAWLTQVIGKILPGFGWERLSNEKREIWEAIAKAVLDAQWKPASEPPNDTRDVLVEAGAWYRGAWFGANGQIIRPIIRWRELPELPHEER